MPPTQRPLPPAHSQSISQQNDHRSFSPPPPLRAGKSNEVTSSNPNYTGRYKTTVAEEWEDMFQSPTAATLHGNAVDSEGFEYRDDKDEENDGLSSISESMIQDLDEVYERPHALPGKPNQQVRDSDHMMSKFSRALEVEKVTATKTGYLDGTVIREGILTKISGHGNEKTYHFVLTTKLLTYTEPTNIGHVDQMRKHLLFKMMAL
jgi:hypothetical protein